MSELVGDFNFLHEIPESLSGLVSTKFLNGYLRPLPRASVDLAVAALADLVCLLVVFDLSEFDECAEAVARKYLVNLNIVTATLSFFLINYLVIFLAG